MSELIVEATRILSIKPHPNADVLELALIKGWQVVVGKGLFQEGDSVVYIPPDALLQKGFAETHGVWKYLSQKEDLGRVRAAKLRQEISYGFVIKNEWGFPEGQDLKEQLHITKWEPPPPPFNAGDQERDHPLFHKYSDIQNIRNFPTIFRPEESVLFTEKLHGTNARVACIKIDGDTAAYMIGSHNHRRKLGQNSLYEIPLNDQVKNLLGHVQKNHASAVLFGEIFGPIQDLRYGLKEPAFRAFDLAVDQRYLSFDELICILEEFDVPSVPILYRGPFSPEAVAEYTDGKTTLGQGHIREGIVIKPAIERFDPVIGRVILKSISGAYLLRKNGSEHH